VYNGLNIPANPRQQAPARLDITEPGTYVLTGNMRGTVRVDTGEGDVTLIMAGATVIGYTIGEGLADAAGAANAVNYTPYDDDDAEYDADDPPDKWGKSGLFHGTSGDRDEDDLK
jgi:hypothetical protein